MKWVRGEAIGHGSFSTVNLATTSSFEQIAVKSTRVVDMISHLENEKGVLDEVGPHPNIIRCLGADTSSERFGRQYNLLLEYAPGGNLSDRVKKCEGRLPLVQVRKYTKSILQGLSHVHRKGFAHCDVKLQNLLLFGDGEVKIADFGLAKKIGGSSRGGGEVCGTPLYMSPESVKGKGGHEASGDIWAVGCAVVEMVSGRGVWEGKEKNVASLLMRIGVGDEVPGVPEELPEEGKDFVRMCFVKDPRMRWTAEMLLGHPWLEGDVGVSDSDLDSDSDSDSPRCVFEFPDQWDGSPSEVAEFDWSVDESSVSLTVERIGRLVGDGTCDWADSGRWIVVR